MTQKAVSANPPFTSFKSVVIRAGLSAFTGFLVMALEMSWLRLLEWQLGSTMTAAALALASFFLFAGWGSWWQGGKATPENAARRWSAAILLAGGVSWLAFQVASGDPGEQLAGIGPLAVPFFFVLAGLGSFFLGISFPALAAQVVHSSRERTGFGGVVYAGELLGGLFGVLGGGLLLPLLIGHNMTMHGLCTAAVLVGLAGFRVAHKGAASPPTAAEALIESNDGKKKKNALHAARVRSERGAKSWDADWQAPLWLIPLSGFLVCGWQIVAVAAVQFQAGFSLWMTTGVLPAPSVDWPSGRPWPQLGPAGGKSLLSFWCCGLPGSASHFFHGSYRPPFIACHGSRLPGCLRG
jgi:hypothetical protein